MVAGVLRRPRPRPAPPRRKGPRGLGPTDAGVGLPVLDDPEPDALPPLGAERGPRTDRRGPPDPPLPAMRRGDGDDLFGPERSRLARGSSSPPHPLTLQERQAIKLPAPSGGG